MPTDQAIKEYGVSFDRRDMEEALIRWNRGDLLMALYYLDRAGFYAISERLQVKP